MATVTKPIALDESFNTTEVTPRNIADVLAEGLSHITGRTASEVEYDNTDSGLTSDDVQGAIDELSERPILPSVDIQTAVDEFETYNGGLLSECKVSLTPNQDLHGYDSPWVGGAGKNLINQYGVDTNNGYKHKYYITQSGVEYPANGDWDILEYVKVEPSTTYTISGITPLPSNGFAEYDGNKQLVNAFALTSSPFTFTTTANTHYIRTNRQYSTDDSIQFEKGSTATTYEPYSNICPITGHTQVEVEVSDGQTTQEQVTVSLGGTYYSGTLDVVSGVLTVDTAKYVLTDVSKLEVYTTDASYGSLAKIKTTEYPSIKEDVSSELASSCKAVTFEDRLVDLHDNRFFIHTNDNSVLIRASVDENVTTVNELFAIFENCEFILPLATPLTIQLSPTMVKALVGENHLSAPLDGQEITESKYKQMFTFDDVNAQIESTYSEGISHNSVYRGKYLGDHVTNEQWDAIGDGSFRDLYIGDYWTINGINWRIAHFNYWLGTGDVKCNTNHVVIVPYGWVSTFNMNASDDTTGGYLNSEWYTTNRHFAVENIEADFGASHILSHRNFFSDAVSDGHASHGMWVDSTVDLMNEIMVCGSLVGSYSGKYYEVGCDKFQLALFKYNPPSARMDVSYWLRGVSTASSFVAMGNFGLLDGFTASQILKIRPVFAIKK